MDILLQELIEFVKTASPVLWGIYIKQAYVDGIYSVIFGVALICVGVVILLAGLRIRKAEKEKDYSEFDDGGAYWMAIIFGILGICAGLVVGCSSIGNFVNPEYQAIQLIIETLK
jgi:uncharacterized membrane protein YfcA